MKFYKALRATFISNILVLGLGIGVSVLTARWLGTAAKGVLSMTATVISLFLIMIDLGIGAANTYFIGKSKRDISTILGSNILIIIFECFVVTLVFIFGRNSNLFIFQFLFKGLSGWILIITLFTIPIASLKAALTNILLGMEQYANYNKLNILFQVFNFTSIFIFLICFNSIISVLIANITAMLAVILCQTFLLSRRKIKIKFSFFVFNNMLRYGIKAQLSNFVQFFTYSLDILIINFFRDKAQTGLYSIAVTLATMMWQIPGTIATIIYPSISNSYDIEYIKDITNKTTRIAIVVVVLFCIILALISAPLILLVYGADYRGSINALVLLIPGIAFFSISKILAGSLAGMGRIDINLKISAIICVLTVVLDFAFIPIYGIIGASVVTSITYICHAILTLALYKRLTSSRITDIILINKADRKVIKEKLLGRFKKIGA
jgi:O-antigen/teichoic acid export membrane protein